MTARRILLVLALALCLVLTAVATAHARTLNGAIAGVVVNAAGKPVAGVTVQAWGPKVTGLYKGDWEACGTPAVTGRNGAYKLVVPPGTYRVWFVPADRETWCMEAYPDAPTPYHGDDVLVRAGKTTSRVSVTLDGSPGALEGTVYDASTGEPLEGIMLRLGFQGIGIVNTSFGDVWSDENGHYRFAGLKPWSWGAWAFDERGVEPHYIDLLNLPEDWTPQPGAETLDFDMEPEGFVSIEGTLTDSMTGLGIPNATVVAYFWEWWDGQYCDYAWITTDANGHFEIINMQAGQWELFGMAEGYQECYYHGDQQYGEELYVQRGNAIALDEWTLQPW